MLSKMTTKDKIVYVLVTLGILACGYMLAL